MSILSTSNIRNRYRCYLVQPTCDFKPTNWQQRPTRFKIVSRVDTTNRRGKADAAKFLHNTDAMNQGDVESWYVVLG